MSEHNSDTLQHMMSQVGVFTGKDPNSDYAPFDIECPATGSKTPGVNAYKEHCEIRVVTEDSNEDCRVCEYGKKVAQRLNYTFLDAKECSTCGKDNDTDKKTCSNCQSIKQKHLDKLGKDALNKKRRSNAKLRRERKKEVDDGTKTVSVLW